MTAEIEQDAVTGNSPDNEQDKVQEMEQYHESGGDCIVSRQCKESNRNDSEFRTIFRYLRNDIQSAGLAQMQHYTIIISAGNVTKGIE